MSFDHNKTAPKKRKKQLPAKEMGEERRSTLSIRFGLAVICFQSNFVSCGNAVIDSIKHLLEINVAILLTYITGCSLRIFAWGFWKTATIL